METQSQYTMVVTLIYLHSRKWALMRLHRVMEIFTSALIIYNAKRPA